MLLWGSTDPSLWLVVAFYATSSCYLKVIKLLTFARHRRVTAWPRLICVPRPPWIAGVLVSASSIRPGVLVLRRMVLRTLIRAWGLSAVSCSSASTSSGPMLGITSSGTMIVFLEATIHHTGSIP